MEVIQESVIREFIKRLPDLTVDPPSSHLLMLALRSKKIKESLGHKAKDAQGKTVHDLVVERDIIRPEQYWRERYFNAVHNLGMLQHEGKYVFGDPINIREVSGIYATLSPRSVTAALEELMRDDIGLFVQRNSEADIQLMKHVSRYFASLHKHKLRATNFVTLDIDNRNTEIFKAVSDITSVIPVFMVTETSGGWHRVLDVSKSEHAIVFYGDKKKKSGLIHKIGLEYASKGVEIKRDSQEVIPGTLYHRKNEPNFHVRLLE